MSKFKICYKSGFTLLEIVFAMLIISLTLAGILGLYVTSQKFVSQAGRRLQALKYGNKIAEHLKVYVSAVNAAPAPNNAGTFAGGVLDWGTHNPSLIDGNLSSPYTIDNISYGANYTVVEDVGSTTLESVTIVVNWTEP